VGAFYGNLHVRGDGDAALAAVRRALDEMAAAAGMRPAGDGEAAFRTVLLRQGSGWLSVFDEQCDSDPGALAGQAVALSRALDTTVITAAVHDSDVLWLGRWDRGEATAEHDSSPGYFDGGSRRR
jgi:hypothetical protein